MFNKILIIMKRLFVIFALLVFSRLSFAQGFQYSKEVHYGSICFIIEVNCVGSVYDPQTGGSKCILDGWIHTSDCNGNKTGDSSVYHVERPITPVQGAWRWATKSDGVTDCDCYAAPSGCHRWELGFNMSQIDFVNLALQLHTCCGSPLPCDTITTNLTDTLCTKVQTHCCNGVLEIKYIIYLCKTGEKYFEDAFSAEYNGGDQYNSDSYVNIQDLGYLPCALSEDKRRQILQSYLTNCLLFGSKDPCE